MPPLDNVSALDFFRLIWGDTPGWAELTAISKTGVKAFPFRVPDSIEAIPAAAISHNRSANVYMGVLLRKEKWPRATGKMDHQGKPVMEHRGTELNAQSSWVVWLEADFAEMGHKGKTVPEATIRKALKDFPHKPSVILKSGGGIQVYWLLKEVAEGDDLWRVKAINKALAKFFGADPQSVDLARILRVPGSMNIKYNPPRKVEITWWKPDSRYLLDDFEDLLPIEKIFPGGQEHQLPAQTQLATGPAPGRRAPWIDLSEDSVAELAMALTNIWRHGFKHESALHISGMFAWAGVLEAKAKAIIEAASNSVGGETANRLKDVESTYRNYLQGKPITGRRHFDEMSKALAYPAQQDAAFFLEAFAKILARVPAEKRELASPAGPEEAAPDISKLQISDYGKKIILEGHDAYVEMVKSIETPGKFRQLKAEGKLTRTEADCWVTTLLLQAGITEHAVSAIFKDRNNKISKKAHEKEDKTEEYLGSVIRECQTAIRSQPKWQPASIARAAAAKVDRNFEDEHFRVKKSRRYHQEPPTYEVTIILEGIEYTLKCSLDQVWKFEYFSKAFFAKFDRHLPFQKDSTWAKMYQAAEREDVEVESSEGTFEGQMDIIINLLEETAVDSKSADISINHSAVRTKDGQVVFKTPIVMRILKDRWSDAKKQDVIHYLKSSGWVSGTKRLGKRTDHVWSKDLTNGNGHGGGNGHPAPVEPAGGPPKALPEGPVSGPTPASIVSVEPSKPEDHTGSDMLFEMGPGTAETEDFGS